MFPNNLSVQADNPALEASSELVMSKTDPMTKHDKHRHCYYNGNCLCGATKRKKRSKRKPMVVWINIYTNDWPAPFR